MDKVKVMFTRSDPPYLPGEVATFDEAVARQLIARDVAIAEAPPEPKAPAEPPPPVEQSASPKPDAPAEPPPPAPEPEAPVEPPPPAPEPEPEAPAVPTPEVDASEQAARRGRRGAANDSASRG